MKPNSALVTLSGLVSMPWGYWRSSSLTLVIGTLSFSNSAPAGRLDDYLLPAEATGKVVISERGSVLARWHEAVRDQAQFQPLGLQPCLSWPSSGNTGFMRDSQPAEDGQPSPD